MLCKILKDFHFARDGIRPVPLVAGAEQDIPHNLVPGLEAAALVAPLARQPRLEAQAVVAVPEVKSREDLRAEYRDLTGDAADGRWGTETLQEKIDEVLGA